MNLGENIYKYRTMNNLSQGALAGALEVSRQSVSKWENNSAVPELDKLLKMSRLFHISLDELVSGEPKAQPAAAAPAHPPARILLGGIMLVYGMVFFLLSIFWGDHLSLGEEFGELLSISIVLLSIALLATYKPGVLAACAGIYMFYSFLCFGVFHVTSLTNYLFIFLAGSVLLVWFIVWGLHANAEPAAKEPPAEPVDAP